MSKAFQITHGVCSQIFTLKQIGDKKREPYVGFMDLDKAYDKINGEPCGRC